MACPFFLRRSRRSVVCLGVAMAFLLGMAPAMAQELTPAVPLITRPVDNQRRVPLVGNVRPRTLAAQDLGAIPANTSAGRILLLLRRPPAQEAALRRYIQEEHTRSSPNYHRWLTPAQLGAQYGPAASDIQAIVNWLQSQGLSVARVSPARTVIEFSGTVGQLQTAFATAVHQFRVNGALHLANVTDPQIPAALAPVVAGISPLNDFHPRAQHTAPIARTAIPASPASGAHAMASEPRPDAPQPDLTFTGSSGSNFYGVTPGDFATIYNTPNKSLNTAYSGTLNLTGSGVTIGIAGDSNVDLTNIANYRSLFGLPALKPTIIVDGNNPGKTSDAIEALLDLEVASAVAPAANLNLYIAQDSTFESGLYLAIQRALDDNVVNILNVSFGGCEADQGTSGNTQLNGFWEQAAAQGISVTVSTGDSGSADCDNPNTATSAVDGLQVNAIASTPYNIAVGGTDFNQTTANASQYWSTTNNSTTQSSVLGYIPELPWNNSTASNGAASANTPSLNSSSQTNIFGGGGGISGCLTATISSTGAITSCTGSYPRPNWQTGFGSSTSRQLPDVSLFAGNGMHNVAWVLCASDLGADASTTDCKPDSTGSFNFQLIGGTSASAPAFAGVLALVIQNLQAVGAGSANNRLGQAATTLYPLSQQFPAAFHDVTTGNNAVYCIAGSGALNCDANDFLSGYNAAAGYDTASGLGSVNVTELVTDWSKVDFKATTTALTVNGSTAPLTIQHGTPVSIAVTVDGPSGTPTGTVALVTSNAAATDAQSSTTSSSSPVLTLTDGSATDAGYAGLPGSGSTPYTLTADYSGDTNYEPSISNGIQVTVTPEPSTLTLTIQAFALTTGAGQPLTASVPYGTYISVAAQPVPSSGSASGQQATGTVSFSSSYAALNQSAVPINSTGIAEIPGQTTLAYPPGAYSVSATYSGDNSYAASSAAAQSFTVIKNNVTITATKGGSSGTAIVQVAPASLGSLQANSGRAMPTGTVTLTGANGATVGTGTLAAATDASGNPVAQATVTLSGAVTGASYPGDANYNSGSASITLSGVGSFTVSASPSTVSVAAGSTGSTSISITPQSGFTGAVALSCSVTNVGAQTPSCTFAQGSVTVTGTAAVTDTLTISAQNASSDLQLPPNPRERWFRGGGIAFAGLFLLGLSGRRRAWQRMLSFLILLAGLAIAGCGGTSSSTHYTVTVTAKSGAEAQTATIAVTVQ